MGRKKLTTKWTSDRVYFGNGQDGPFTYSTREGIPILASNGKMMMRSDPDGTLILIGESGDTYSFDGHEWKKHIPNKGELLKDYLKTRLGD